MPISSLSRNVPILSCGALSKTYMVPGWRMGWIIIHDRNGGFASEVTPGLAQLARKVLSPCTLVQAALPEIFNTPQSYHDKNIAIVHRNAVLVYQELQKAPGITPIMPAGAMYMMVYIVHNERKSIIGVGVVFQFRSISMASLVVKIIEHIIQDRNMEFIPFSMTYLCACVCFCVVSSHISKC